MVKLVRDMVVRVDPVQAIITTDGTNPCGSIACFTQAQRVEGVAPSTHRLPSQ